ncbi:hypothetical protein [Paraburkholderia rhizosphaerae]|uniref:Uncharacterized protein n=1 Tax=Paraburkholderia rhizosphaerae TaxID=480658 RepID=A0A4R8L5H9_9BURK|nr:hypothetical protein [Paraburkholderia rhizosphaerae]TDY37050.1 hypothetical protein BX592_1469 [Paraburkholderia rhizosphaerae]
MRIVFWVPVISLTVATRCMAFDAWDFVSGENKSTIERMASARGDTLQQGRLAAVTKVEPFTPANFINTLSELMKLRGTPAISVHDKTMRSFADFAFKEVQYTWGSLDDRIQLTTNISTAPSLKLEPGMTLKHDDTTICGLTPQVH